MHRSTFTFWLMSLVMCAFVAFLVGYASPHVPKESRREVRKYHENKEERSGGIRPTATITTRLNSEGVIGLALGLSVASLIFFFFEGLPNLVNKLGGDAFASTLALLIVLVIFVVTFAANILIYVFAATISSGYLEKFYKRHYGVDVVYDLDEPD